MFASCEPGGLFTIKNQRNENIVLYVATVRQDGSIDALTKQGIVSAGSLKTFHIVFLGSNDINRMEIQDLNGNVLFSHDYKLADIPKTGLTITVSSNSP